MTEKEFVRELEKIKRYIVNTDFEEFKTRYREKYSLTLMRYAKAVRRKNYTEAVRLLKTLTEHYHCAGSNNTASVLLKILDQYEEGNEK